MTGMKRKSFAGTPEMPQKMKKFSSAKKERQTSMKDVSPFKGKKAVAIEKELNAAENSLVSPKTKKARTPEEVNPLVAKTKKKSTPKEKQMGKLKADKSFEVKEKGDFTPKLKEASTSGGKSASKGKNTPTTQTKHDMLLGESPSLPKFKKVKQVHSPGNQAEAERSTPKEKRKRSQGEIPLTPKQKKTPTIDEKVISPVAKLSSKKRKSAALEETSNVHGGDTVQKLKLKKSSAQMEWQMEGEKASGSSPHVKKDASMAAKLHAGREMLSNVKNVVPASLLQNAAGLSGKRSVAADFQKHLTAKDCAHIVRSMEDPAAIHFSNVCYIDCKTEEQCEKVLAKLGNLKFIVGNVEHKILTGTQTSNLVPNKLFVRNFRGSSQEEIMKLVPDATDVDFEKPSEQRRSAKVILTFKDAEDTFINLRRLHGMKVGELPIYVNEYYEKKQDQEREGRTDAPDSVMLPPKIPGLSGKRTIFTRFSKFLTKDDCKNFVEEYHENCGDESDLLHFSNYCIIDCEDHEASQKVLAKLKKLEAKGELKAEINYGFKFESEPDKLIVTEIPETASLERLKKQFREAVSIKFLDQDKSYKSTKKAELSFNNTKEMILAYRKYFGTEIDGYQLRVYECKKNFEAQGYSGGIQSSAEVTSSAAAKAQSKKGKSGKVNITPDEEDDEDEEDEEEEEESEDSESEDSEDKVNVGKADGSGGGGGDDDDDDDDDNWQ